MQHPLTYEPRPGQYYSLWESRECQSEWSYADCTLGGNTGCIRSHFTIVKCDRMQPALPSAVCHQHYTSCLIQAWQAYIQAVPDLQMAYRSDIGKTGYSYTQVCGGRQFRCVSPEVAVTSYFVLFVDKQLTSQEMIKFENEVDTCLTTRIRVRGRP